VDNLLLNPPPIIFIHRERVIYPNLGERDVDNYPYTPLPLGYPLL
jgi:hypothetical protein